MTDKELVADVKAKIDALNRSLMRAYEASIEVDINTEYVSTVKSTVEERIIFAQFRKVQNL